MTSFETIVVLDFEATCDDEAAPDPQEVIELPSVLVSLAEQRVVDSFEAFVRPVHHPRLTPFCTELTGITQADVAEAPVFTEVLARHQAWLRSHGLLDDDPHAPPRFAFVTCGDWDLMRLFPVQCAASEVVITDLPAAYRAWINIKHVFTETLGVKKAGGMVAMLRALELDLIGRHHRGIDDSHNIARIALALAARGATFPITGHLPRSRYPDLVLHLRAGDETRTVKLTKRTLPSLLGLGSGAFRRKVLSVEDASGQTIDDQNILHLSPDQTLTATLKPPR